MSGPHESESPVAAGQVADQSSEDAGILTRYTALGNDDEEKIVATIIAKFASAGHAVHKLASGGYLVINARWAMSRHCASVHDLSAFAREMGVR